MSDTARAPQTTRAFAPRPVNGDRPFISVIVPVRNEAAFIAGTLRQLLTQDYDPRKFEVLVADGGSTDATRDIVNTLQRRHPNLRLLANPAGWSSAGRNVAVRASRGDVVVLVDGHCDLDNPGYLADLADAFEQSGAACVGRPQPLDVPGATPLQRAVALARASRLGHHPASHIYSNQEGFVPPQSVAIAYKRAVFETVGLFDESFDACEDVEMNHRVAKAGLPCWFTPKVRVRYHPRGTLAGLCRQMFRYGRGRSRLLRKHPETFSVGGFLPAAFLLGLAVGPVLAGLWAPLWFVYGGVVSLYALAVLGSSARLAVREPGLLPLLPPAFLAIHFGAGAGVLWEAATGRRSRTETVSHPSAALQRKAG
jgi:glycosyltransferase involved in cell wall biosynthesis